MDFGLANNYHVGVVHNFQPFHKCTNRMLGGGGKITCTLFKMPIMCVGEKFKCSS